MSFAVWNQKPPFELAPEGSEHIYQVGDKWVVTDDPARAMQANVDAVLNQAQQPTGERQFGAALEDLDRAIDAGETEAALRLVRQLLQEK